jgi:hypothetical protein
VLAKARLLDKPLPFVEQTLAVRLDFDFPSLFVGAAPEFHGFGVVDDVAGFGVEG